MKKHAVGETNDPLALARRPQAAAPTGHDPSQRLEDQEPSAKAGPSNQELSRGILDSLVVGVMQFDKQGGMTYANAFAQRIVEFVGLAPDDRSLRGFEPWTIRPDGSPFLLEDYPANLCLRTGQPQGPTTLGLRRASGETRWLTISTVPGFDPLTGTIDSAIATFIDVTHSKRVEESLRQSEDRYRRLVEEAPDAIIVHQDGKLVFINDAGVELWGGKTREEFLGRDVFDFIHPHYRKLVEQRIRQAQAGQTVPLVDQVHYRLDGRKVRVEVTGMPCVYDGKPSVQAILRDVTQRRRVERQVRRQRELLRKFFERIPMLVGLFDSAGRLKMVNREWNRVLGWEKSMTLQELIERCYVEIDHRRRASEFMQVPPPGWTDTCVKVRDGRILNMSWATIALSDGTRISIGQDITERKKAEATLQERKSELEQRVRERTEQLLQMNGQLRDEIIVRGKAETALQEKQQILEHLLDMHERYRQLLAYEIHDTFVQDVIGALMFLDVFCDNRSEAGDTDLQHVVQARTLLKGSVAGARRTISGLRPPIIDEQGVVAAIEYLVSEMNAGGMNILLRHNVRFERMASVLEAAIFRVVQEGLANVQRHSQSRLAQVELEQQGDSLEVKIRDFGSGFDPQAVGNDHFGLRGIRERVGLFGGTVAITSSPGEGTEIVARFPLGLMQRN